MIPLMMQKDYAPKGWLGLILGTRLWYAMWDVDEDDDAAFERRLGSVIREIADRGKLMVAEAVPPEPMPAPDPAPAPAPTLTSAPAPAPAHLYAPAPSPAQAQAPAPAQALTPATAEPTVTHQSVSQPSSAALMPMSSSSCAPIDTTTSSGAAVAMDVSAFLDLAERMQRRLREEQVSTLQSRLEALHNAKLLTVGNCYQSTASRLSRLKLSC